MTWGQVDNVVERFTKAGVPQENISFEKETFTFRTSSSPKEFLSLFRNYYGPTMNAFEAAEKNGKAEALQSELENLFSSQNKSGSDNETLIPATYLKVTVNC
jgi:hypothetical protein